MKTTQTIVPLLQVNNGRNEWEVIIDSVSNRVLFYLGGPLQSTIGVSPHFSELGNNSADGCYPVINSINRTSDGATNYSTSHMQNIPSLHNHQQSLWNSSSDPSHNHSHNSAYATSFKSNEHCKIGDFQRLCLMFPDHSPSQLQAHYG